MHHFANVIFDLLILIEKLPYGSGLFLDFPTFLSKQYSSTSNSHPAQLGRAG